MFDPSMGMYYNRARWYDPATGRFNRTDPFAGSPQDPQSLHKYLYAHCNPINNIDPTGNFSLTEMVGNMAINSLLMEIGSPIIEYAGEKVANLFLPKPLITTILSKALPTTFLGGVSGAITAGWGIGVGGLAGREVLWSPTTHNWATYKFSGWTVGAMSGSGVGLTGSAYGGVVWGAEDSKMYRGPFWTYTFERTKLLTNLKRKISDAIASMVTDMILYPPGTAPSVIDMQRKARSVAVNTKLPSANTIVNLFHDPSFTVVGFSFGVSASVAKGLEAFSVSRTEYIQINPHEGEAVPFRQSQAFIS